MIISIFYESFLYYQSIKFILLNKYFLIKTMDNVFKILLMIRIMFI